MDNFTIAPVVDTGNRIFRKPGASWITAGWLPKNDEFY
jgi:hypothetical protein